MAPRGTCGRTSACSTGAPCTSPPLPHRRRRWHVSRLGPFLPLYARRAVRAGRWCTRGPVQVRAVRSRGANEFASDTAESTDLSDEGSLAAYSAARGIGDEEARKGVWTDAAMHMHTVSIASPTHADEQTKGRSPNGNMAHGFHVSAREPLTPCVGDRASHESGTVVIRTSWSTHHRGCHEARRS